MGFIYRVQYKAAGGFFYSHIFETVPNRPNVGLYIYVYICRPPTDFEHDFFHAFFAKIT